jgi:hypothetical protein
MRSLTIRQTEGREKFVYVEELGEFGVGGAEVINDGLHARMVGTVARVQLELRRLPRRQRSSRLQTQIYRSIRFQVQIQAQVQV